MTLWSPLHESIRLEGVPTGDQESKRIDQHDAERQTTTARAILERLHDQPGVVLADEVGMGKTFVALAVATSITLADVRRRPVVVMVPSSLSEKWPRDLSYFAARCLDPETAKRVRCRSASSGVELLKLLDDPIERRASIIFLTHGAMHRGLTDGWVKLAVIQRALFRRHHTQPIRKALARCAGELLRMQQFDKFGPEFWGRLMDEPPTVWLSILREFEINSAGDDDPVPQAVIDVLHDFDTQPVYEVLLTIPHRDTPTWKLRVGDARRNLTEQLKEVWKQCLAKLRFKLPLLVMDEAHHLKNADTNLAKLFRTADAENDANEVSRGALAGVFERMLFLTATPFQLGHHELCSVLERFDGIAWKSIRGPASGREAFQDRLFELREWLDAAQRATLNLEVVWGRLRPGELVINGEVASSVDAWWATVRTEGMLDGGGSLLPVASGVWSSFQSASRNMRAAEQVLRPFVVRHLRPRVFNGHPRRERLPGAAILSDSAAAGDRGIEVSGPALVPFLLAARATTCEPDKRPVFAEGLASSYEAFLHTRHPTDEEQKSGMGFVTDGEDAELAANDGETSTVSVAAVRDSVAGSAEWYLEQLERSLPLDDLAASGSHPKIAATAKRVLSAWRAGEKVLVFCHFKRTGRTLRQVISGLLHEEIERLAAEKLACPQHEAGEHLARYGQLFRRSHGDDSPARRAVNAEVENLLEPFTKLHPHRDLILKVCHRFIRTPSFLVRYFALDHDRLNATAIEQAFADGGDSGLSLRAVLAGFFRFLTHQCEDVERQRYLDVILRTQTGAIHGDEALVSFAPDEAASSPTERLLPNVRLVNGESKHETRQRLMLTFNSPFFPEVLIASSVMAEGVDLHRFCRYVIHHDLCWNPSMLEQRTGRVDRIGAKVEQCGQPIRLYLPYLGETQDEKQYRVVMDRERWFSVVMGESFRTDARTTERLADRLPLPEALARELAFRLEAVDGEASAAFNE